MVALEARARPALDGAPPAAPAASAPATFITASVGSDDFWRSNAPARVLGAKVITVPPKQINRAFTRPNSSTALPWRIELETEDGQQLTFSTMKAWTQFCATRPRYVRQSVRSMFPTVEGTVVWQRPDMARAALALAMQREGVRTIAETDDNYFADPRQNPYLRHVRFSDRQRMEHAAAFARQDACVFSTAHLRDVYHRELRARFGKKAVPDMYVCRNHVPAADWPDRVERDGPLRVGFMGSLSHVWDIAFMGPAPIRFAREMGCETIFVGYNPADPDGNTTGLDPGDDYRNERSRQQRARWEPIVSRHIPWIPSTEYHRAALPLDIGLAPLRADGFTMGRSDSKLLEYAISGVAIVCSNVPVYNTAGWKHGLNCLMASKPEDFAVAVVRLIRDPQLRYELVANAQQMVMDERGDDAIRKEWGYALRG